MILIKLRKPFTKILTFAVIVVSVFNVSDIHASTPSTIRVGLESSFKDKQQLTIGSTGNLKLGISSNSIFQEEVVFDDSTVLVKKSYGQYFSDGETYNDASLALAIAEIEGAYVLIESDDSYIIVTDIPRGNYIFPLEVNNKRYEVYSQQGELELLYQTDVDSFCFQGNGGGYTFPVTYVGNSAYRGVIEVINGQYSGLTAVNVVDLEDYLYGVVPSEIVPSWPIEALKAQAVVARTVALYQYNKFISRGYNVVDTVSCQAYKGVLNEHLNTTIAVDQTKGQVVKYNGNLAETLYFSTSGGYTEDPVNVWGTSVAYLKAVEDVFEIEPYVAPWTRTIRLSEIDTCLANNKINIGQTVGVQVVSRTLSGRVNELKIIGTNGIHSLTKENIRTFFSSVPGGSLKSRLFEIVSTSSQPQISSQIDFSRLHVQSSASTYKLSTEGHLVLSSDDIVAIPDVIYVQSASGIEKVEVTPSTDTILPTGDGVIYSDLTIQGKGYGHGVGMSQSGAKGMATLGFDYQSILKFYYQNVEIE